MIFRSTGPAGYHPIGVSASRVHEPRSIRYRVTRVLPLPVLLPDEVEIPDYHIKALSRKLQMGSNLKESGLPSVAVEVGPRG